MKERNNDRLQLDSKRSSAARYFCENYSREERYLIVFARDFEKYLMSADYLRERDTEHQFYWDFLTDFERFRELMKEFRWSKDFLKEHGIDFNSLKKLYFAVA